jgi:uncharacterized protein (TIGR02444 family)
VSEDFELWTWAASTYACPGVPARCLRLQDEHGFDVNVALACVWAAHQGWSPSSEDIEAMLAATSKARRRVEDLRVIRKDAKGDPAAEAFYAKLKAAELAGEKVVQRGLCDWLVAHPRSVEGSVRDRADAALRRYAEHLQRWPSAAEALRAFSDAVVEPSDG